MSLSKYVDNVIMDIYEERVRQFKKWGSEEEMINGDSRQGSVGGFRDYLLVKLSVLGEEFGEACMARNDGDIDNLRTELIQVAAVATAIVEGIDLYTQKESEVR